MPQTTSPTIQPLQPQLAPPPINYKLGPLPSKQKRLTEDDASKFANISIDDLAGQIYYLCKDQYGCRYLQKQIEEKQQAAISVILAEIFHQFAELMVDPFGNYLCQKLVEYCTDKQRGDIIDLVSHDIIPISLNMHGTRAVQKLIEFVTVPHQVFLWLT
jgi:hypothetical protein